jgi:hypothetical protein
MDPLRTYPPDRRTIVMKAWAKQAGESVKSVDDPSAFAVYGLDYAARWIDALRAQLREAGIEPKDP